MKQFFIIIFVSLFYTSFIFLLPYFNSIKKQIIQIFHKEKRQDPMIKKPNLVLDIDDFLLHSPSKTITSEHEFFSKKSFLIQDSFGHNYIVPAYFSEFFKFVTSKFNITFFSSGIAKRNKSVIQDIWLKVFNVNKPKNIKILSRENLTNAENINSLQGKWYGNQKKDISQIGTLDNTILIDDDKNWSIKGQESNLLKVPSYSFYRLQHMTEFYHNKHNNDNDYNKSIEKCLINKNNIDDILAYYKLLYIIGILDIASKHKISIINGLYDIQFKNDEPIFDELFEDLQYYKRGHKVLSEFLNSSLPQYFPEIEKHIFLTD